MGFIKGNAMPLLIGIAVGYFVVPRVLSAVKNR